MECNSTMKIFQICRTCMEEIVNTSPFFFVDSAQINTEPTFRQKLHNCIPELDLSITPSAVICVKCADTVNSVYNFKNECLHAEMQIHKYIQQIQHTGDAIDLVEVAQLHQRHNFKTELKVEQLDIKDFRNKELSPVCDTTDCSEWMEHKLPLEKIDTHHVFLNINENYINNSFLTEESSDVYNKRTRFVAQQNRYIKNLSKNNYFQCFRCGHREKSKAKLMLHLKHHTKTDFHQKKLLFRYYRCCLCNYLTKYKYLFNFHNRIHLTKKNCMQIFKLAPKCASINTITFNEINKNDKGKHAKHRHNIMKQNCIESKYYLSQNNSVKYIKSQIVKKLFNCSLCEYQCKNQVNLKSHMRLHIGDKLYTCSLCEYQCDRGYSLKMHMLIHTGEKPYKCSICEYRCRHNSHLQRHMRIHTGDKPYKCNICEYQFSFQSSLKSHMVVHTGEMPYKCYICEYQCKDKKYFKKHMESHPGAKLLKCTYCEYQCNLKDSLKKHMRIHTEKKLFKCSFCEYQCGINSVLKRHMQIHTVYKPFACSLCEYQCTRKYDLENHMLIHTGEKPYKCPVCEHKCRFGSNLKRHMQTHNEEKRFKCYVCEYECINKENLKIHMQIHPEVKLLKCAVCEYLCKTKVLLKTHMQTHTGEKPFECSMCEYRTNRKGHLNRHMITHTRVRMDHQIAQILTVAPDNPYRSFESNELKVFIEKQETPISHD